MLTVRREGIRPSAPSSAHDFHFSRGVAATFSSGGGMIVAGADSTHALPPGRAGPGEWDGEDPRPELEHARNTLSLELVAVSDATLRSATDTKVASPTRLVFRTGIGLWDHDALAEELLAHLLELERLARILAWKNCDAADQEAAERVVTALQDAIRNGHAGPEDVANIVSQAAARNIRVPEAFYVANAVALSEDVRSALLRACHHSVAMASALRRINSEFDVRTMVRRDPRPPIIEIEHYSPLADNVAEEFVSSLSAAYTTLDVIYKLFVYFGRTGVIDPDIPGGLHFPDVHPEFALSKVNGPAPGDPDASAFPMALPNIPPKHFSALRHARDSVVHDMAPDSLRANVFVGRGGPLVGGLDLQYAQYVTRDIETSGVPVRHRWVRRFYQQHRDAQVVLHSWIEDVWQTALDTVDWLRRRLEQRARSAGLL